MDNQQNVPMHGNHPMVMLPPGRIKFKDFIPLIVIFAAIFVAVGLLVSQSPKWNWIYAMQMFMASFFLVFGGFKAARWKDFAESYQTYDIVAKKFPFYSYLYPAIEIILGLLFFFNIYVFAANVATVLIMAVSGIGVARELLKKERIYCACLGAVFKIPMTWVTFGEDALMAIMAIAMILLTR